MVSPCTLRFMLMPVICDHRPVLKCYNFFKIATIFHFHSEHFTITVMNATTYVVPEILHRKLVGNIGNVVVSVHEHDSTVGQFNPQYAFIVSVEFIS